MAFVQQTSASKGYASDAVRQASFLQPRHVQQQVLAIHQQLAHAAAAARSVAAPAADLPLWKTITTATEDQGLLQVVKAARVQDIVIAYIMDNEPPSDEVPGGGCGCETLSDFYMMTSKDNESNDPRNLLDENTAVAKRIVSLSRLRQAWQLVQSILTAELTDTRGGTPPPARRRAEDEAMEPANL